MLCPGLEPLDRTHPPRFLLSSLINRCADVDTSTRKFACFAVGNACFHSQRLYNDMRPALLKLLNLLTDDDEKTRANAAGALGNMVRNSVSLCDAMVECGVPLALLKVATADASVATRRVAVFSIGNLVVYASCRRQLVKAYPDLPEILLSNDMDDKHIKKYISRIKQKMGQYPVESD